jgi:hypothetical protein
MVGGDWNHGLDYDFPSDWEWNVIIPTDFNSITFQRGWLKPPTRKCWGTEATGVHVDDFTQKTIDFSDELAKKGKESG